MDIMNSAAAEAPELKYCSAAQGMFDNIETYVETQTRDLRAQLKACCKIMANMKEITEDCYGPEQMETSNEKYNIQFKRRFVFANMNDQASSLRSYLGNLSSSALPAFMKSAQSESNKTHLKAGIVFKVMLALLQENANTIASSITRTKKEEANITRDLYLNLKHNNGRALSRIYKFTYCRTEEAGVLSPKVIAADKEPVPVERGAKQSDSPPPALSQLQVVNDTLVSAAPQEASAAESPRSATFNLLLPPELLLIKDKPMVAATPPKDDLDIFSLPLLEKSKDCQPEEGSLSVKACASVVLERKTLIADKVTSELFPIINPEVKEPAAKVIQQVVRSHSARISARDMDIEKAMSSKTALAKRAQRAKSKAIQEDDRISEELAMRVAAGMFYKARRDSRKQSSASKVNLVDSILEKHNTKKAQEKSLLVKSSGKSNQMVR